MTSGHGDQLPESDATRPEQQRPGPLPPAAPWTAQPPGPLPPAAPWTAQPPGSLWPPPPVSGSASVPPPAAGSASVPPPAPPTQVTPPVSSSIGTQRSSVGTPPPSVGMPPPAVGGAPSTGLPPQYAPGQPARSSYPGSYSEPAAPAYPGGYPGGPSQPSPAPYAPSSGYPSSGLPASGIPASGGPVLVGQASGGPALGGPHGAPPTGGRRRAGTVALVLSIVLLLVAAAEGVLLYRMDRKLSDVTHRADQDRSTANTRAEGLEKRATELEKQLGNQFNPAAVAAAALPSVFRVAAGQFTGTAFAVGREPSGGGTYLFTNFHVVESVWTAGGREVFLERKDARFPATIVKVNKDDDVALLQSKEKFPALKTGAEKIKSGEQVAVVGAPLGLEDSVTTGVVSAYRKMPDFAHEVFQFDAAINPGNSGGPVVNAQKQVVGIASAKAREAEGIGLAVQIATACEALGPVC